MDCTGRRSNQSERAPDLGEDLVSDATKNSEHHLLNVNEGIQRS